MYMHTHLKRALINKTLLKIISGIQNFEENSIFNIVKAAELAKATYVDIAAIPSIIQKIKQHIQLPLCISTLDPSLINKCILAGADIVEVGNYDCFYSGKSKFSLDRIFYISEKIRLMFPEITLCVTIPHDLSIEKQIYLAKKLQSININMLQTEGITSQINEINNFSLYSNIKSISTTLSMTYILSQTIDIPIITASGINSANASSAIKYGADGLGIGSAITKFENIEDMTKVIKTIKKDLKIASANQFNYHEIKTLSSHFLSLT
uniref:Uncharacterized protein ycf23 n=1 Tax=Bangiopsis subsimplex TaxID=139980 RepID=A0A1C9CCH3_9RHOD|nr:hypothetical protein Bangp_004 [Bangiopsis subsimplex]AOM66086.1 hypothetical protein Bangp_004 [Bangiopsis subsimplex]ARO90358.1 conserved hypothetical plastid protein [Bangiopsis subsimplex]